MKCWRCLRTAVKKITARNFTLTCDYTLTGKQAPLASEMGYAPH